MKTIREFGENPERFAQRNRYLPHGFRLSTAGENLITIIREIAQFVTSGPTAKTIAGVPFPMMVVGWLPHPELKSRRQATGATPEVTVHETHRLRRCLVATVRLL